MKKIILIIALIAGFSASAQVDFSKKSFDRKQLKKELKVSKKNDKHKLIVSVLPEYDETKSLTVEGMGALRIFSKAARRVFEEAMFSEGFNVIDRSTIDNRFKVDKKGGVFDEGQIALGKTKQYNSSYLLRFKSRDKTFKVGGVWRNGEVAVFDLDIIDMSQGGKIVARAQYRGKALPPEIFYPALASELRSKINENKN